MNPSRQHGASVFIGMWSVILFFPFLSFEGRVYCLYMRHAHFLPSSSRIIGFRQGKEEK